MCGHLLFPFINNKKVIKKLTKKIKAYIIKLHLISACMYIHMWKNIFQGLA